MSNLPESFRIQALGLIAPTTNSMARQHISSFMSDCFDKKHNCILCKTNPKFAELAQKLKLDIDKKQLVITETEVQYSENYEEQPLTTIIRIPKYYFQAKNTHIPPEIMLALRG